METQNPFDDEQQICLIVCNVNIYQYIITLQFFRFNIMLRAFR